MLLLLASLAFAQEPVQDGADSGMTPPWYAGRSVASVNLFAGEGELPDEDLAPLLRARQGEPLDPATLQLDLRTLYRVAPLAAVEADVRPWFEDQVVVRYVLFPATKVASIQVQGAERVSSRKIAAAARLAEGDVFEPEHDAERVREQVRDFLVGQGFPNAKVELETYPADPEDPFALEVWLRVQEGAPRLLGELRIDGIPEDLPPGRVRRWARKAGLKPGKPLADDAITRARLTIRQEMAHLGASNPALDEAIGSRTSTVLEDAGLLQGARGWVEARVSARATDRPDGQVDVELSIDAGRRLELEIGGVPGALAGEVRDALGVNERLRMTRGFLEAAPDRVEEALAARGFRDAAAAVTLDESGESRVLRVDVETGRRHRRRRVLFVGNDSLRDAQLRTVLNQASPEVLRRRRLTPEALERGLEAARALYASVGHEDAELRAGEVVVTRRLPLFSLDRSTRWVAVAVRVEEGPVTRLERLEVQGVAPSVPLPDLDETLDRLADGPWSPQGVQALAQRVVDAHRAAGFLEAQARVRATEVGPRRKTATIVVSPGERILLRSFATRGNRRVSSRFLRRTVAPPLGTPVTAATLDTIRQRLYDLGMFASLQLQLVGDGAARDLVVDLRERPRNTVEAGLGLASDQGIRALGRWTTRNILGPADKADTNALIGLRFASTGGLGRLPTFRRPEYRLGSSYSTPLTRSSDLTLTAIALEEIQERNWRSLRRALGMQFEGRPTPSSRLQLGARLEVRRLADADPGAILDNDVWASPDLGLPPDPSIDTRWRIADTLEAVWLDDHRDNPLQPTRGVLYQGRVAFSPGLVQPVFADRLRVPVLAVEARTAAVLPLGALSLQLSAEGGHQRVLALGELACWTVDDSCDGKPAVPVEQRYRMGGTASLRGFARDGVGPLRRTSQLDLDWPDALAPVVGQAARSRATRWVPTGGDTFARGTADLLIPLPALGLSEWEGYDLALFADLGQVWFASGVPDGSTLLPTPAIRWGTGVGLRVVTPVGPLRLDLALNPQVLLAGEKYAEMQEVEPPARIHLSLGTLF